MDSKPQRGEKASEWVESDSHGWICELHSAAAFTGDTFKPVVDENELEQVFPLNLLRNLKELRLGA